MAQELHIDVETYSSIDIRTAGAYKYTESIDFEILMVAYAFDDEPIQMVDLAQGEILPQRFIDALVDPKIEKHAHNANFERNCFRAIGYDIPIDQWHCSAIKAAYCGLPLSLGQVSIALKLEEKGKLSTGKALIRYFCVPIKPTKANGRRMRNLPEHETFRLNELLAEERRKYIQLEQGLDIDMVFGCHSEENLGGLELNLEINLTPMLERYIELYGMPLPGQGVDSIKLTQIKEDMIEQGIDPYHHVSDSDGDSDTSEPDRFDKNGPFSVNGYYPLYLEQSKAIEDSPNSTVKSIVIGLTTYWMPQAVKQYLGDYDEWNTFRENDTFDNIIKTWNNDIEEGTETIFVANTEDSVIITVSFDTIN